MLGETFELSALQALSGRPAEELLASLEAPLREGFVVAEDPNALSFCHALLRSVLYDRVPADRRAVLHRRAAETLERVASPRYAEIANHHYSSLSLGDPERVTRAAERAARVASRMQAFADASRFCEWALQAQRLERDAEPRARAELLLFTAQMQSGAGDGTEAQRTITAVLDIARSHGFFELLVRAARILRPTHMMGTLEDPLVRSILEEALRHAPEGANEMRVSALSQLSWVPPYGLDLERSKELSERALGLARELGDEAVLLRALNARLYALSGPDDTGALLAVASEMLAASHKPRAWVTAAALGARYGAELYRGDVHSADTTRAELGRLAHAHQWPAVIWYHDRLAVQRRLLNGDFSAASRALGELRERGKRWRVPNASPLTSILQGVLVGEQSGPGALAGSLDVGMLRGVLESLPVNLRPGLGRLLFELGEPDAARSVLDRFATDGFSGVPREIGYLEALADLAVIAVGLGERAHAERLYALLAPYPHHNTPNVLLLYRGSVSHFLGVLAAFLRLEDRVERHFDDALAMNEVLGAGPQLARTCDAYARWLLGKGKTGERKGRDLQHRARAIAEGLGMTWGVARVDSVPTEADPASEDGGSGRRRPPFRGNSKAFPKTRMGRM